MYVYQRKLKKRETVIAVLVQHLYSTFMTRSPTPFEVLALMAPESEYY